MSISVKADNVTVRYLALADAGRVRRSRVEVEALTDVSFELHDGDALGVIGHNGCGKSTLMQVIAGFLPPTEGSILVSSQPQLLGVNAALNPRLSGQENITLCCLALGLSPKEVAARRDEIAEFTGLDDFLDLPANTYSAGMRQRLGFAISVVARPEILLIDEALAVGDKEFKDRCLDKLNEVRESAGTVVLATHAMGEITATCNKALWFHEGRIVMAGPPDEVTEAYTESQRSVERKIIRR